MRPASKLLLPLCLTACATRSASRFQALPLPRAVSVGTALDEARWRAQPVDTIMVRTSRLDLRQGEIVSLARVLSARGHAADGAAIPGFLPVFLIEGNGDAVQLTERGLEAVAPGTATILVLPLAAPKGRSVVTRVPVTVGAKPVELSPGRAPPAL